MRQIITILVWTTGLCLLSCTQRTYLPSASDFEERVLDTVIVSFDPALDVPSEEETSSLGSQDLAYRSSHRRAVDILDTDLSLRFDWEKEEVLGIATLTVTPYFYPIDEVVLDAKYFDIHDITIPSSNNALSYDYDSLSLRIQLPMTCTRQDTLALRIRYTVRPKKVDGNEVITSDQGLFFIKPDANSPDKPLQIWTQGQTEHNSKWFPTVDKPNERCTQRVELIVSDRFRTLSNGVLTVSEDMDDGMRRDVWEMDMEHAPYLFMVVVGDYAVVKDRWRDIDILYMVEPEYEEDARMIFNHTPEMIDFFSNYLGYDYPWQKYAQVVVRDYVSGAMENTTSVIFGEFVQRSRQDLLDDNNDDIVAHELVHHWFGDLVTCESWSHLTLNEGFATYGEYLWQEYKYGRDAAMLQLMEDREYYFSEIFQGKIHPLIRHFYHDKEEVFDSHSYNKGALVLHMLRSYVGDEAFRESIELYLKRNENTSVEAHDLRLAFEDVTGQDLNWFFDQWFFSQGHPTLEVTHTYDSANQELIIDVHQPENPWSHLKHYILPADIAVYDDSGMEYRFQIFIDEGHETLKVPLTFVPMAVNFNPDNTLLISEEEIHDQSEKKTIARYSSNIVERLSIISEMGTEVFQDQSFLRAILEDTSEYFLAELLTMIPVQYLESHRERILDIAQGASRPALHAAAIDILALQPKEPLMVVKCRDILRRDEDSYAVIGSAFRYLSEHAPQEAASAVGHLKENAHGSLLTFIANYMVSEELLDDDFFLSSVPKMTSSNVWEFNEALKNYISLKTESDQVKFLEQIMDYGKSYNIYSRLLVGNILGTYYRRYRKVAHPMAERLSNSLEYMIDKETIPTLRQIYSNYLM